MSKSKRDNINIVLAALSVDRLSGLLTLLSGKSIETLLEEIREYSDDEIIELLEGIGYKFEEGGVR